MRPVNYTLEPSITVYSNVGSDGAISVTGTSATPLLLATIPVASLGLVSTEHLLLFLSFNAVTSDGSAYAVWHKVELGGAAEEKRQAGTFFTGNSPPWPGSVGVFESFFSVAINGAGDWEVSVLSDNRAQVNGSGSGSVLYGAVIGKDFILSDFEVNLEVVGGK